MTHQEEHESLAAKLLEAKLASQELYIEHHNGDDKLNKRIMAVRDSIGEASVMLNEHKKRTAGVDKKVERYHIIVKILWFTIATCTASLTKLFEIW